MLAAFTRLRLVSDGRRPTMLVLRRGVSGDAQVKPSFGVGQFSLTVIEVQSITFRERKIKSRTEIRRADKIELKNVTSSRRKLFVFRIMEIKNIYRFSRDSRELS
jgi:hypothetical protein